jgi:hypothetical protein
MTATMDRWGKCCKTWKQSWEHLGYKDEWTCGLFEYFGDIHLSTMAGVAGRDAIVSILLKRMKVKTVQALVIALGVEWIAFDQVMHACMLWTCIDDYSPECACKSTAFRYLGWVRVEEERVSGTVLLTTRRHGGRFGA